MEIKFVDYGPRILEYRWMLEKRKYRVRSGNDALKRELDIYFKGFRDTDVREKNMKMIAKNHPFLRPIIFPGANKSRPLLWLVAATLFSIAAYHVTTGNYSKIRLADMQTTITRTIPAQIHAGFTQINGFSWVHQNDNKR
jgi:hypothetical protein